MLFNFVLLPVEHVPLWKTPRTGEKGLHWYALTDGQYWLEVGDSALFEYSEYARSRHRYTRYCDYQVALLHEDLMQKLPHILEAVPSSLVSYLSGESGRAWYETFLAWQDAQPDACLEGDEYWETVKAATAWMGRRALDTMHLASGAGISIWSDNEMVHIEWDNSGALIEGEPVWSAVRGCFELSRAEFVREVSSFHASLMSQMGERVEAVVAGALPADVHVDLVSLQREQIERSRTLDRALRTLEPSTDWERTFAAISEINRDASRGVS